MKGRTVADGRPQRKRQEKRAVASPTVALEAVLITAAIKVMENRDVL